MKLEPNYLKRTTCPRTSAILHFRFGRPKAYGLGEEPIFVLISLHLVRALLVHVKRKKKGRKGRRRNLGF